MPVIYVLIVYFLTTHRIGTKPLKNKGLLVVIVRILQSVGGILSAQLYNIQVYFKYVESLSSYLSMLLDFLVICWTFLVICWTFLVICWTKQTSKLWQYDCAISYPSNQPTIPANITHTLF